MLELNASDERGISVVRDKIKHFASLAVGCSNPSSSSKSAAASFFRKKDPNAMDLDDNDKTSKANYPNPHFKIIILDEADTVTRDAQAALRRIIVSIGHGYNPRSVSILSHCLPHSFVCFQEAHSKVTRFILICNYVTRIIEPLASRCAKFRFQALPPASMKARLTTIAQNEGCSSNEMNLLDDILEQADGDMRRAVTTLQSIHALTVGGVSTVSKETIAEISGQPPDSVVDELWNALGSGPESAATAPNFDSMQKIVEAVCLEGYSAQILLSSLLPKVVESTSLSELSKAEIAIRIAEAEKNMIEGADEYLQFMTVCTLVLNCVGRDKQQKQ